MGERRTQTREKRKQGIIREEFRPKPRWKVLRKTQQYKGLTDVETL